MFTVHIEVINYTMLAASYFAIPTNRWCNYMVTIITRQLHNYIIIKSCIRQAYQIALVFCYLIARVKDYVLLLIAMHPL